MPYINAITRAGKTILCERYYSTRYQKKGIERAENVNKTQEQQEKINIRKETKKLTVLMNANFSDKDYHLELTYQKVERPITPSTSQARPRVIFAKDKKGMFKAWHTVEIYHMHRIRSEGSSSSPFSNHRNRSKDI